MLVLVTGATGYIGSRLVPELLAAGLPVRVMARRSRNLVDRDWYGQVETVEGDAANRASLTECLRGVDVAYYLIHSLAPAPRFEARDLRTHELRRGGAPCKVGRIVYLGGLYPEARS